MKRLSIVHLFMMFLIIFLPLAESSGEVVKASVIQVKDGDTIVVLPAKGGQAFTCRLYGIDAPEVEHGNTPGQPYGEEAKRELKRLILGKTVTIKTTGGKTYNREVCIIYLDSTDINLEMVRRGYAWAYKRYLKGPYASEYIGAENDARKQRPGLWVQSNPTPPWEFRKLHREERR